MFVNVLQCSSMVANVRQCSSMDSTSSDGRTGGRAGMRAHVRTVARSSGRSGGRTVGRTDGRRHGMCCKCVRLIVLTHKRECEFALDLRIRKRAYLIMLGEGSKLSKRHQKSLQARCLLRCVTAVESALDRTAKLQWCHCYVQDDGSLLSTLLPDKSICVRNLHQC